MLSEMLKCSHCVIWKPVNDLYTIHITKNKILCFYLIVKSKLTILFYLLYLKEPVIVLCALQLRSLLQPVCVISHFNKMPD